VAYRLVEVGSGGEGAVRVEDDEVLARDEGGRVREVVGAAEAQTEPTRAGQLLQLRTLTDASQTCVNKTLLREQININKM
jgi:hypothetical protein